MRCEVETGGVIMQGDKSKWALCGFVIFEAIFVANTELDNSCLPNIPRQLSVCAST